MRPERDEFLHDFDGELDVLAHHDSRGQEEDEIAPGDFEGEEGLADVGGAAEEARGVDHVGDDLRGGAELELDLSSAARRSEVAT